MLKKKKKEYIIICIIGVDINIIWNNIADCNTSYTKRGKKLVMSIPIFCSAIFVPFTFGKQHTLINYMSEWTLSRYRYNIIFLSLFFFVIFLSIQIQYHERNSIYIYICILFIYRFCLGSFHLLYFFLKKKYFTRKILLIKPLSPLPYLFVSGYVLSLRLYHPLGFIS